MRVLLTGATSFTGAWFAWALTEAGHSVLAVVRRPAAAYTGLRATRLQHLGVRCAFAWDAPFGSSAFLAAIVEHGPFDVLCHHASEVTDYKNPDFDVTTAVAANTHRLTDVLAHLSEQGCRRIVVTGTVFEPGEGAGTDIQRAGSPYGLSKGLSSQLALFYAQRAGWAFGKFVIPNPFGPWESERFTDYLARTWAAGQTPCVAAPAYVRDNIHVSLLALAYANFVVSLPGAGVGRLNPSGYVESQSAFAERFAREMRARLASLCPLEFAVQRRFDEPAVRVNTDVLPVTAWGWNESSAWDELADYYARKYASLSR